MTAAVLAARRQLAIGGPNALSWCVVAAYAVALGLAIWAVFVTRRAYRRLGDADPEEARRQQVMARVWVVLAIIMFVLGISRQFDLQSGVLTLGRRIAYEGGWYGRRRRYQEELIFVLVVSGVAACAITAFVLRRVGRRMVVVLASVTYLLIFAIVRTISFHRIDHLLARGGRFQLSGMLEGAGIALVVLASLQWYSAERSIVTDAVERATHRPASTGTRQAVVAGSTSPP